MSRSTKLQSTAPPMAIMSCDYAREYINQYEEVKTKHATAVLTGLGMREGDEWVCAPSISERPSYLHLLDTEPLRPSVLVRTLRHSAHVSRKLLGPKCSKCFNDIDSGTEYFSWAGIVADQFFWYYTHGRC
jgi:hypothetical protein